MTVVRVRRSSRRENVYNLEVDQVHSYFVGRFGALVHNQCVWDYVSPTQPLYPGTVIPRSFTLATENGSVWVDGNATEHIYEYARHMMRRGATPEAINLASQQQIRSLHAAVGAALTGGVPYAQRGVQVGGWVLAFRPPRQPGQLPALIHAFPHRP